MSDDIYNNDAPAPARNFEFSWQLPLLLVILTLLVILGFQLSQMIRERQALSSTLVTLNKQIDDSQKLRGQAWGILTDTIGLADQGNASAGQALDDMKRQNIDIRNLVAGYQKEQADLAAKAGQPPAAPAQ